MQVGSVRGGQKKGILSVGVVKATRLACVGKTGFGPAAVGVDGI